MEIKEIKERLGIVEVLAHYGLKADRSNRVCCPFHEDRTPSLQIYPGTNTFCCFSSNCNAGTGDVIEFIRLKENCSKHEAILKAGSLSGGQPLVTAPAARLFIESAPTPEGGQALAKVAVLMKLFKYFSKALPLSGKAVEYLSSGRNIKYKAHEVGYNAGDWHHQLKGANFLKACA